MPADALNYSVVASELNSLLYGGRIDKITMPEKDEIVLYIRSNNKNYQLLISANPSSARCHLTTHSLTNPQNAPSFCMHLRKYLSGGNILGIEIVPFERIIKINIASKNELAFVENKVLIAEIMGKYSNIILVNSDGKISECIKHITLDTSSKRQVLPALTYTSAPPQDKVNIIDTDKITCHLQAYKGGKLDNYILKALSGLAPISITESIFNAVGTNNYKELSDKSIAKIIFELQKMYSNAITPKPCILYNQGRAVDYFYTPYNHLENDIKFYPSLNEAMDDYYFNIDKSNRFLDKSRHLQTALKNTINRTEKKLGNYLEKLNDCADFDQDRINGELLTANIYMAKYGMTELSVINYYTNEPHIIKLEGAKSPAQNAQKYYKKYTKKKRSIEMLNEQISLANTELDYYESIMNSFRLCTENTELEEIIKELTNCNIIKQPQKTKKVQKEIASPLHKINIDGYTVIVGKNNSQNDRITKQAKATDLWMHTLNIHGSHVIIENGTDTLPPIDIIEKAAQLCAYNSKAYQSGKVPVDYTFIKYVSKPKGAALGKVIYTNQKTIYVAPKEIV